MFALGVADKFIRRRAAKTVLVIGAETLTRMVDWTERTTCVLFGDGAGAVVLKADTETGILSTICTPTAARANCCAVRSASRSVSTPTKRTPVCASAMMGHEVFKHAVKALDSVVEETLEANDLDRHDIDWLNSAPGQLAHLEATAKRLACRWIASRHRRQARQYVIGLGALALDEAVRSGRCSGSAGCWKPRRRFHWGSALLRY